MKRFILYFLILVVSIWIGVKIFHNPGYVLITNQDWVIETTLWFAILSAFLTLLFLYFLIRLLSNTLHVPERLQRWRIKQRSKKSRGLLNFATDDLLRGNWKEAEKQFVKSTKDNQSALLGYLGAARAAYGRKLFTRGNHYLTRARSRCPAMQLGIDIALAKLQMSEGLYVQALNVLLRIRTDHPKQRHLLELITQCYIQLSDWDNLYKLLPDIRKARVFDEQKLASLEKEIYLHFAKHSITNYDSLHQWWKKIPSALQVEPEILAVYTYYLNEFDHSEEAEKLLRHYLNKHWHEQLYDQYVSINSPTPSKQIAFTEKFLALMPNNPNVLRGMAKLCLKNQLWGQAKDYLEQSIKLEKSKESYRLLGLVMEKLGDTESALDNYRKGCN